MVKNGDGDWRTWWGEVVVEDVEGLKIVVEQLDVRINGFRVGAIPVLT